MLVGFPYGSRRARCGVLSAYLRMAVPQTSTSRGPWLAVDDISALVRSTRCNLLTCMLCNSDIICIFGDRERSSSGLQQGTQWMDCESQAGVGTVLSEDPLPLRCLHLALRYAYVGNSGALLHKVP